jgi:ABC-type dipeptide/oligopeptide/nickel transport system ATPase subunit
MKLALEIRGLSKTYKSKGKKFESVKGISFNIEKAKKTGLLVRGGN